jgi:4-hydroxy-tetrahydrodipicolinate reductase
MTMTVAVTGASGRMGSEVLDAAHERGIETIAISRDGDIDVDADGDEENDIHHPDDVSVLLAEHSPDALVDFTVPEASTAFVAACAETGTPIIIGTTGFEEEELATIQRASERIPILRAANFARGIQTLLALVRESTRSLEGYDVELTETHHNGKRDAPSGTAKTLLEEIEDTNSTDTERVHGREGIQPRSEGEIGVHVRRAGDVRGEHELLFAGNDEVLTLTHRAESRRVFAAGALDAAEWLTGQEAGQYDFSEVLR